VWTTAILHFFFLRTAAIMARTQLGFVSDMSTLVKVWIISISEETYDKMVATFKTSLSEVCVKTPELAMIFRQWNRPYSTTKESFIRFRFC
jgi:hypothetical protein